MFYEPPRDDRSTLPFRSALGTVEFFGKYAALFTIAALATAMLYDAVFWNIVNPSVLGWYAVSDHIETGVHIIVYLAVAMVFFVAAELIPIALARGVALIRRRQPKPQRVRHLLMGVIWIVFAVYVAAVDANNTVNPQRPAMDSIHLGSDGELLGYIVRVLDKGVVLWVAEDRRIVAIPKDRITRIDSPLGGWLGIQSRLFE